MEDILASIRRIIAEDQSNSLGRSGLGGLTRRSSPVAAAPASASLAESLTENPVAQVSEEPEMHAASQADVLQHAYVTLPEAAPEPVAEPQVPAIHTDVTPTEEPGFDVYHDLPAEPHPADLAHMPDEGEPLMSPLTGASITSSFQTLAESVVLQDPGLIERVMRESMRPLLKAWLDDHLPSIVERLVRTEIERVARGGRTRNT